MKTARILGILISVLVLFASCAQLGEDQSWAKVRVASSASRAISDEERANSRLEYYFNGRQSGSNETLVEVGSDLHIKVVSVDSRNGKQIATGEMTHRVVYGTNNVTVTLREDRGADANTVIWSVGSAKVGQVENMPAATSHAPGDIVTVPQNPTWVYADAFNGWSCGNAQLVDENDSPISGNLTAGKKFKVPDGGVTLTAEWTPTQYTINYNTGSGGSGSATGQFNATQSTVQLDRGSSFSNVGNVLTKWLSDGGAEIGSPNSSVSVQTLLDLLSSGNNSITLTAKWEALQTFAVTFAPGDQASAQSMPSSPDTYNGGTISLTQKPTATGYDFKGWKVTKTDSGAEITTLSESETQYTMPGEYAITLTAQWQQTGTSITIKIQYIYGMGTGGNPSSWSEFLTGPHTDGSFSGDSKTLVLQDNTQLGYTNLGISETYQNSGTTYTFYGLYPANQVTVDGGAEVAPGMNYTTVNDNGASVKRPTDTLSADMNGQTYYAVYVQGALSDSTRKLIGTWQVSAADDQQLQNDLLGALNGASGAKKIVFNADYTAVVTMYTTTTGTVTEQEISGNQWEYNNGTDLKITMPGSSGSLSATLIVGSDLTTAQVTMVIDSADKTYTYDKTN